MYARSVPAFRRALAAQTALRAPTRLNLARAMATAPRMLDVAEEIKLDHDNVRDLFQRFQSATSKNEKGALANTLIREMAVHSDAEEVSVYNDYIEHGLEDAAAHNKEEHATVKKLVYDADAAAVDQHDYEDIMARAVNAFLEHAEEEEAGQLQTLKSKLSPEENDRIARNFLKARTMSPERPHPWAPQTGGIAQKAVAAQGRVHDKVVQLLGGRDFVQLKFHHPENF